MPTRMTVLKWEDEEKEAIKQVSSAQLFQAAVKPIVDEMKDLARGVASVGATDTTSTGEVEEANHKLRRLRELVDGLPGTEEKNQLLERIQHVDSKLQEALSLQ